MQNSSKQESCLHVFITHNETLWTYNYKHILVNTKCCCMLLRSASFLNTSGYKWIICNKTRTLSFSWNTYCCSVLNKPHTVKYIYRERRFLVINMVKNPLGQVDAHLPRNLYVQRQQRRATAQTIHVFTDAKHRKNSSSWL